MKKIEKIEEKRAEKASPEKNNTGCHLMHQINWYFNWWRVQGQWQGTKQVVIPRL